MVSQILLPIKKSGVMGKRQVNQSTELLSRSSSKRKVSLDWQHPLLIIFLIYVHDSSPLLPAVTGGYISS